MESFQKAIDWLGQLTSEFKVLSGAYKPTLETTQKLLKALDDIDRSFRYRVIIGGTAGKGTVVRKLCQTLHEQGIKVGCMISPHLQSPIERVRLGDRLIDPETWGKAVLKIKALSYDCQPTCYEVLQLAGLICCYEAGCEIFIAEVGLGGEFDATNALRGPRIAGVTFIGDDHKEILGDLPDIARTKAKIFNEDSILNLSWEKQYQS